MGVGDQGEGGCSHPSVAWTPVVALQWRAGQILLSLAFSWMTLSQDSLMFIVIRVIVSASLIWNTLLIAGWLRRASFYLISHQRAILL